MTWDERNVEMMIQLVEEGNEPYLTAAVELLKTYEIRVIHWRPGNTGVAYIGKRIIEAPIPKGIASFLVLAHEVGHQALQGHGSQPRWIEETEAWNFALKVAKDNGFKISKKRKERIARYLAYSYSKALRRSPRADELMGRIGSTYPAWWNLAKPLVRL